MFWQFDPTTQTVHLPDRSIALNGREADAFAYLHQRLGMVVSRADLEREVWGLRAGVRSQTVPVTLRKLRARLGPAGPRMLATERGVGWRLIPPVSCPRLELPLSPTPDFPRPALQRQIRAAFDTGWRVITLSGPGGIGKTRALLAFARQHTGEAVYVALQDGQNSSTAFHALLRATGMVDGDLETLQAALHDRPLTIFVDGADRHLATLTTWIERLSTHRFVITSRRVLGRAEEVVVPVPPLLDALGRRFFRRCLRAAPWHHSADDTTLDALLNALDGLPLAIEICAAGMASPAEQLLSLQSGRAESHWDGLQSVAQHSIEQLTDTERTLLICLCVPETALSLNEILAWQGVSAQASLSVLAQYSLVQSTRDGWRVLRSIRRRLVAEVTDNQRADFDRWLAIHAQTLARSILACADQGLERAAALQADLANFMRRAAPDQIDDLVWLHLLIATHRGPLQVYRDTLAQAQAHASTGPLSAALHRLLQADDSPWPTLAAAVDRIRLRTALGLSWLPADRQGAPDVPTQVDGAAESALLVRLQMSQRIQQGADPLHARQAVAAALAPWPLIGFHADLTTARALHTHGRHAEARAVWRTMQTALASKQLPALALCAQHGIAEAAAWLEGPEIAIAEAHKAHLASIERGWGTSWVAARPGLFLALRGLHGAAEPLLEHGLNAPHQQVRALCAALLHAGRLMDADAQPRMIHLLDPKALTATMADGTSLGDIAHAILALARSVSALAADPKLQTDLLTALPKHGVLSLLRLHPHLAER